MLEVKDWKLDTLQDIDKDVAFLRTERGLVKQANPLLQARSYLLEIVDVLQRDLALIHPPEHPHAGKLVLPWGYGAVLTNIPRAVFEASDALDHALPAHHVICQDEMTESADAEEFQKRLWDMFDYTFGTPLSLPQIDRIRWHVFPEIRVTPPLQPDLLAAPETRPGAIVHIPDVIRVMDRQQEQLARSLGDGHRVIHGVAGSGKTMILGYRCRYLARSLDKPILVLCFNRTLAARLAQVLVTPDLRDRVEVRSFHAWCALMLRTYHVPPPKSSADSQAYFAAQIEAVIRAVERGDIPRAQYGAVLIDEGHDFEPAWFRLVVQMIDPLSNSLLLLYDDAQSIYARPERRRFSFASVGIEARGRTTVLKLNYRNTFEVLAAARAFAQDLFDGDGDDEDTPNALAPESVGRHGPVPQLIRCASLAAEAEAIAAQIDDARSEGTALDQIAVLWRHGNHADAIARALARRGLAHVCAKDATSKDRLFDGVPSVKLVSMHSSKGLEFERVFLPALHSFPVASDDHAAEARLLYVAMTRATARLVMTCSGDTGFFNRVEHAIKTADAAARAA